MTVGDKIRQVRKSNKLTQKQLAEISGVAEISIRNYENHKREPKLGQLQKIATALGISLDELLDIKFIEYPGDNLFELQNKIEDVINPPHMRQTQEFDNLIDRIVNPPYIRQMGELENTIQAHDELMKESEAFHKIFDECLNDTGKRKVIDYTGDLITQQRYLRPGVKPLVEDKEDDSPATQPKKED